MKDNAIQCNHFDRVHRENAGVRSHEPKPQDIKGYLFFTTFSFGLSTITS